METRIRELRKAKGWTLQQVADLVETTPQTVQRLETANMTVSTDWLDRFAQAFSVRAIDLIRDKRLTGIPVYGHLGRDGILNNATSDSSDLERLSLTSPAQDPVAVRLSGAIGPYRAGATLIANRLRKHEYSEDQGRDALVMTVANQLVLGRAICRESNLTLMPLSNGGNVWFDMDAEWIAPLVMEIRYL